jgi:hypothetical protein
MKKSKEKKSSKHVLLWCARSGCDVGAHGAVVRRSLGWLGRSDHEIGFALVDRTPQKLEGEREYHGIQKKKLLGIVGNRLLTGLLALAR